LERVRVNGVDARRGPYFGMLYGVPLTIESPLPPSAALERIHEMVAARQMIDSPRFRRRQVLGWRFREEEGGFMLQPEYGDAASDFGARFEGIIEQAGSGSRIGGVVILSRTMRITMSVWFLFVVLAASVALAQGTEARLKVMLVTAIMIGAGLVLVRYSLRSTHLLVDAGLRGCLQSSMSTSSAPNPTTQSQPNRSPTRE